MGNVIYKLKISIEAISFFIETNDYVYSQGTLDDVDRKTYRYLDAQSFFDANKRYLYMQIMGYFEEKYGFSPTEINLGKNGIYIVKEEDGQVQIIRPLFQKIDFDDKQYDLSDIIKNKLYKGNIKKFYECDQFREALGGYTSFFNGLDHGILSRIVTDSYSSSDIVWIWDWIKDSNRICPLMRFLLMDLEHFDGNLNEYYGEVIPAREREEMIRRESNDRAYNYRAPYKDD